MKLFFGLIFALIGVILCVTIVGAIIGIPLLILGSWLIYSWRINKLHDAIKRGIVDGSHEIAQKSI